MIARLNCQVGDAAQVVRMCVKRDKCESHTLGRVVTVREVHMVGPDPCWSFDELILRCHECKLSGWWLLPDANLKPLPKSEPEPENVPEVLPVESTRTKEFVLR